MSSEYTNYLATTKFRPYLQPYSYLGTSARTAGAIILGGRSGSAGSAARIYNFLTATGKFDLAIGNFKKIANSNLYRVRQISRNYTLGW